MNDRQLPAPGASLAAEKNAAYLACLRPAGARLMGARVVAVWLVCQLLLTPVIVPALRPVRLRAQADPLIPIAAIQGAGLASPLVDEEVVTWGVVTGVTPDGFYLQDPAGDGDAATSDGVYAYTYNAPTVRVGECVQVVGEVAEYYAKTELNWLTSVEQSTACAAPSVVPVDLPRLRPGDDPVALLEAYEGMVVRLAPMQATVHSPTKHYASGEDEIAFLPSDWQRYFGDVHLFQHQPEVSGLLFLSNRLGASLPNVAWGDWLQTERDGLVGVLDYNFGKYQLLPLPDQTLTVTFGEDVVSPLPPLRVDEYGVCSFNVHGLGQGSAQFPDVEAYAAALSHRAGVIATWLDGCTVLALQETGTLADAEALAATLLAEHGLAYEALALAGPNSNDEAFPLTNSILVDAARVTVEGVELVTGCAARDFGVFAPGVCGAGTYPVFDRPPLLAKLHVAEPGDRAAWDESQTLWVINNHWKSKAGDETANARLRAAQAAAVAERVQGILAEDAAARVVVLGDLNDFYGGAAVAALQDATGLFQPYDWLPPLERYTYLFNGAAQVLDHALVTPNLATQLAHVQILHVQADYASPARDGGPHPQAASDHDPVVLRFRPNGAANVGGTLAWGEISVVARDALGIEIAHAVTDANGDFRLWGLPTEPLTLTLDAPSWIVLEVAHVTGVPVEANDPGMIEHELPPVRHVTAISGAWLALHTPWLAEMVSGE